MNEPLETIMEERKDFMVSIAGDSNATLRAAHFLKPTENSTDGQASVLFSPSVSSLPPIFEPKKRPLAMQSNGWRHQPRKWIQWVDTLHSKYESVWEKVGIYEAIMSTKCDILKNEELLYGVAERWCSKTNTFVFPWAEATITLEDIVVLGGYPVLGDSVFNPLETHELKEIEEKLLLARKEAGKTRSKNANISTWIALFSNCGDEIKHEHEAFLAAWLSIFVFPGRLVREAVFPIAIHLSRGNPIALAPAVLASIYKDLALLKRTITGLTKNSVFGCDEVQLEVTLQSPFYLVQIWVWERFKALQPKPNLINNGDPLLARWHKVKALKVDNVRLVLDSAAEDFLWRPYVRYAGKCRLFYPENEMRLPFDPNLHKEIVSIVKCMRVSELVGLGCIEQYLPHRVAMQFGMDQDVPGCVPRFNETPSIAWENYCKPISDCNLYFPPRLFEADVTSRYLEWWKQSVQGLPDPAKKIVQKKRSPRSENRSSLEPKANRSGNDADLPPRFPPKRGSHIISGNSCEDVSKPIGDNDADVPPGFLPKHKKTLFFENSVQEGAKANENSNADVPTCFSPKHNTLNPSSSVEDCKPIMDTKLFTALSCAFRPNVTPQYDDWWKQPKLGLVEDLRKGSEQCMATISSSNHLLQASCVQVEGEGSNGPSGFRSKRKRDQAGDFNQEDKMTIKELLSSCSKVRWFEDEVVGNGNKALSSSHSGVLLSSIVVDEAAGSIKGGVHHFTKSKDVLKGSKRTMEHDETEEVGGATSAKEDVNEAKMESPFCDTNTVNGKGGAGVSPCTLDIASDLDIDNQIWELERLVAKLEAAKFGPRLEKY